MDLNYGLLWAHSPMVEHIVCNDEIRVRFPMGPLNFSKNKFNQKQGSLKHPYFSKNKFNQKQGFKIRVFIHRSYSHKLFQKKV